MGNNMNRDSEILGYSDMELLSVDGLQPLDGGPVRIGVSLVFRDDQQPADLALSVEDAEKLVLALARACYDVRSGRR